MSGREMSAAATVVYCLLPRELAPQLHDVLRRHFRGDPGVEVVVEQRSRERRGRGDRRVSHCQQGREERRLIRNPAGRRISDRRASVISLDGRELPRKARRVADRILFVERLEPSTQEREDRDTARVITCIQTGDRDAFAQLYVRYFDRVYGYLRALMKDRDEAEDATQQVFANVLEGLSGYEHRSQFRGWLFTIARNHALTSLQRRGRTESLDLAEIERRQLTAPDDELGALNWLSDRELQLFVERLSVVQRQTLYLRYAVGLRNSEVAAVLGQTPEAVRQHHVRATAFLRARLSAIGRGPKRSNRLGVRLLVARPRVVRARRYSLIGSNPAG